MQKSIPSENKSLLKSLYNRSIIHVEREIFKGDMDLQEFEQMADGSIKIKLSNHKFICFFALTEIESIGISCDQNFKYGDEYVATDVTNNSFWSNRVNKRIKSIQLLKSKYASEANPSEFGIEFTLDEELKLCFEYINTEDFPDTLRVIEECSDLTCLRDIIF